MPSAVKKAKPLYVPNFRHLNLLSLETWLILQFLYILPEFDFAPKRPAESDQNELNSSFLAEQK